jgi:hypothetical protein
LTSPFPDEEGLLKEDIEVSDDGIMPEGSERKRQDKGSAGWRLWRAF